MLFSKLNITGESGLILFSKIATNLMEHMKLGGMQIAIC